MATFLIILAMLCVLLGVAGSLFPVLPGPPLSFLGLLLMRWSGAAGFSDTMLWIWGGVTVVISILDYLLPGWLARRFGGSKGAATGATWGAVVGLFFIPPWGMIVGSFVGALIGEWRAQPRDVKHVLKVAWSAVVSFLLSTGLKLGVAVMMGYLVIRGAIVYWQG